VEKVFKHKQLELQLAEAKMAQQHLQFNEDKEKTLTENQLVRKCCLILASACKYVFFNFAKYLHLY